MLDSLRCFSDVAGLFLKPHLVVDFRERGGDVRIYVSFPVGVLEAGEQAGGVGS